MLDKKPESNALYNSPHDPASRYFPLHGLMRRRADHNSHLLAKENVLGKFHFQAVLITRRSWRELGIAQMRCDFSAGGLCNPIDRSGRLPSTTPSSENSSGRTVISKPAPCATRRPEGTEARCVQSGPGRDGPITCMITESANRQHAGPGRHRSCIVMSALRFVPWIRLSPSNRRRALSMQRKPCSAFRRISSVSRPDTQCRSMASA